MRLILFLALVGASGWLIYSMQETADVSDPVHAGGVEHAAAPGAGTGGADPAASGAATAGSRQPRPTTPVRPRGQPEPDGSSNPFEGEGGATSGTPTPAAPPAVDNGSAYLVAQELLAGRADRALELAGKELGAGRRMALAAFVDGLAGRSEVAREKAAALFDKGAARPRDLDLLKVVTGLETLPLPAAAAAPDDLELSQEALLWADSARQLAERRRYSEAARRLSRAYMLAFQVNGPLPKALLQEWGALLDEIQSKHRWNPNGEWPHVIEEVQPGDSLQGIRARVVKANPGLVINTGLIATANGMDQDDVIRPGMRLRIPTDPVRTLVDIDSRYLLVLHGEEVVEAWSVGVGRDEKPTPVGEFRVGNKQYEPVWFREGKAPLPFGHPDNELGTRWVGWRHPGAEVDTDIGFHGTNDPSTIGKNLGAGCIRLQNSAVERLYEILPRDTVILSQM
jgi:lipoprotein-anchoring transpeptidase ErfK/SrfK